LEKFFGYDIENDNYRIRSFFSKELGEIKNGIDFFIFNFFVTIINSKSHVSQKHKRNNLLFIKKIGLHFQLSVLEISLLIFLQIILRTLKCYLMNNEMLLLSLEVFYFNDKQFQRKTKISYKQVLYSLLSLSVVSSDDDAE